MNRFNHSNEPVPEVESKQPLRKDYRNIIIGTLAAAILGLGAYLIYDKSHSAKTIDEQQTALSETTTEKSRVQTDFDASLSRLDSMAGANNGLNTELKARNEEIAKVKEEIRTILNKQNATATELSRAKSLISK